jgi:hypothetical protein
MSEKWLRVDSAEFELPKFGIFIALRYFFFEKWASILMMQPV